MKIKVGNLYHIKNWYFKLIGDGKLMLNHECNKSRPSYLVLEDGKLLWFIPLSTQVSKYKRIIDEKVRKYGKCKSIIVGMINGFEQAILLQNSFPVLKEHIKSPHQIKGNDAYISESLKRKIENHFKYLLLLKEKGNNLFFTDIDSIKDKLLNMK